jgi:hypothetical protein
MTMTRSIGAARIPLSIACRPVKPVVKADGLEKSSGREA